jgi:putative ABC transport system permease protein
MRRFFLRLRNALRRDGGGHGELARELQAHLTLLEDEYQRRGMTADEARHAARRALGSSALAADRHRDARSFVWVEDLRHDLAHAIRGLRRSPGFASLAVLALGLGIGVNTVFFTLVDAACLRGLPIDEPDRVLYISLRGRQNQQVPLSWAEFEELRARTTTLGQLGAYVPTVAALADDQQPPARVLGAYVPAGTFELLGDRPAVGRTFRPDEDRPGGPQVVVLGNEIWRSRFAGDERVIGQSIRINGIPTTVIGVMPRGFMFPANADLWRPMANLPAAVRETPTDRRLAVFGRMTAAATLASARAELAALDIDATQGTRGAGPRARLEAVPINAQLNPSVWQRTWLAFITAGVLVLLVACANVANLLLMRAATRGREIAIRTSIGATRWRVGRQLLAESATLAALAGAAGVLVAWAGLHALSALLPPDAMPYWMAFTMNGRVLAVTTAVCLGCVFVCGVPSALHLSRVDVLGAITADSPASMARPARRWIGALLTAEFAVTLVLVSLAVTAVRVDADIRRREFQVDTAGLLTMWVNLPADWYPTRESRQVFVNRLEAPVSGGNVGPLALATALPFGGGPQVPLAVDGRREEASPPLVSTVSVNVHYFDVMRVPLTRGRAFTAVDGNPGYEAAIVNERFVRMFLPQQNPLQTRIRVGGPDSPWLRIVGVATTVRQQPFGPQPDPVVFLPFRAALAQTMAVVVRTPGAIDVPVALLREHVARLNPNLPVFRVMTLTDAIEMSAWNARLSNVLVRSIAVVALLLAVVGLYAVTGHTVERWRRELGLRVALGAGAGEIRWLVIRRVFAQLGTGLGVGVVGTQLFNRPFSDPADTAARAGMSDPVMLASMVLSIGAVALLACLPAIRRATRVDPLVALRTE